MPSLEEIVKAMEGDNQEEQEWTPTLLKQTTQLPQTVALVKELGDDELLAEAALAWVREKKREMILTKLIVLRGQDYVDELRQRMESENYPPGENTD